MPPEAQERTRHKGFSGLRVLSLESRRGPEMAKLIASYGGQPISAPSLREAPLESNTRALEFASLLINGQLDIVIFLTGVGTRALTQVVDTAHPRDRFVAALKRVAVVARGPKPAAVLREMEVPIALLVPEPNTWRELLQSLDEKIQKGDESLKLRGRRVAVQEYGVSNPELVAGLSERGASVTSVPVYQWALPEDTGPLRAAVNALIQGEVDVAMFTSSAQVEHLLQIASAMGLRDKAIGAFELVLVASIGPITSQELRQYGINADFEPSHPKMGFLVNEAADRCQTLLGAKKARYR